MELFWFSVNWRDRPFELVSKKTEEILMRKQRKNYTTLDKVFILKRHLVDRMPISDLCDQYEL